MSEATDPRPVYCVVDASERPVAEIYSSFSEVVARAVLEDYLREERAGDLRLFRLRDGVPEAQLWP